MNHVYYLILTEDGLFFKILFYKRAKSVLLELLNISNFLLLIDHLYGCDYLASKSVLLFTCGFTHYTSLWSFNRLSVSLSTVINSLDAYKLVLGNIAGFLFFVPS